MLFVVTFWKKMIMKKNSRGKMDTLELHKDKPVWTLDTIENDLQRLYDHFRKADTQNQYLRAEIEKVRAEKYASEEMTKMKERYEEMRDDYFRGFPISKEEEKKIHEWMDSLPEAGSGAIGGRFTYKFTPTSIGVIGTVVDGITGKEFTFQEL